jgi:hypothetical protein
MWKRVFLKRNVQEATALCTSFVVLDRMLYTCWFKIDMSAAAHLLSLVFLVCGFLFVPLDPKNDDT